MKKYKKQLVKEGWGVIRTYVAIEKPQRCMKCSKELTYRDECYYWEDQDRLLCLECGLKHTQDTTGWKYMVPVTLVPPDELDEDREDEVIDI